MGSITGFPIVTAESTALTGAQAVSALEKAHDMPAAADVTEAVNIINYLPVSVEIFGIAGDFDPETEAGTDDYAALQAAFDFANTNKRKLVLSSPCLSSAEITVNGFVDFECVGSGGIFATGTGRSLLKCTNNYQLDTTFSAVSVANYPVSTGEQVSILTVSSAANISVGTILYVKDSATEAYSRTSACFAEIATVTAISGTSVYLDCRLNRPITSGSVYILPKTTCNVVMNASGDTASVRSSILYLEGYADASVDLKTDKNSSAALMLMSCLRGDYFVDAKHLDNKPAENRLGYAAIAYGACKSCNINVLAQDVRHAYTDGVYSSSTLESGHCVNNVVTGICYSSTAAAWDTHPDSDGTVFNNIQAYSGHNNTLQPDASLLFALQLRSSNTTVNGLTTDMPFGVNFAELGVYDSKNLINNYIQRDKIVGTITSSNRFLGVRYSSVGAPENTLSQTASSQYIFNGSSFGGIEYAVAITSDEYNHCNVDLSRTTRSFPSITGGSHVYAHSKIYKPVNLIVIDKVDLRHCDIVTEGATFNLQNGADVTVVHSCMQMPAYNSVNNAFAYTLISSGTVSFKWANLSLNDGRIEDTTVPFKNLSSGGTVTLKNISATPENNTLVSRGDGNITLTVGTDTKYIRQAATLTANRTIGLSTVGARNGDSFEIFRSSAGAFTLTVGGLKALNTNEWCKVVFDGAAWQLAAFGNL